MKKGAQFYNNTKYMENTARNFALQLGSLISLYVSLGALIALLFGIITVLYPDPAQYTWELQSATASIRTGIAILIVFFPTYIILTRLVNNIRRREQGTYLTLTRWLIYISLLIGGVVLLGDLVTVIMSFLNGELTIRFLLKALTVFVVVGGAFTYYVFDARGYWQGHERESIRYGIGASVIVLLALILGYMHIETPMEVRERNIDQNQINDLQIIQDRIEIYYGLHDRLPESIEAAFEGLSVPEAPEGRMDYSYRKTDESSFELCAEFAYPSNQNDPYLYGGYVREPSMVKNPYNWDHAAGEWCFERAINVPVPQTVI